MGACVGAARLAWRGVVVVGCRGAAGRGRGAGEDGEEDSDWAG